MQLFETWTGPDFLAFYGVMLATCIGLALWIPANLRPEGRLREVDDPEEVAVLAGGGQRHALAVLADLFAKGGITTADKARVAVARSDVQVGPAGAAVLRKVGAFSLSEVVAALAHHTREIEQRLVKRGLLMDSDERRNLRLIAIAPYGALLLIGLYRQQAGSELGEPTGFLIALMVLTGVVALVRLATIHPRTSGGDQVLKNWRQRSSRLKRAPDGSEAGLAVGLFGTAVLVGTPFAHVHAMRQAASGGDSGSGGDGDGGSGCGGGCGGCGG